MSPTNDEIREIIGGDIPDLTLDKVRDLFTRPFHYGDGRDYPIGSDERTEYWENARREYQNSNSQEPEGSPARNCSEKL